jgi:hypothetical protein
MTDKTTLRNLDDTEKTTKIKKGKSPRMLGKLTGGPPASQSNGIQVIIVGKDGKETKGTLKDGEVSFAKGGRAGFKHGSKGCKLAMKGKGRAYGKNS